MKSVHTYGYSIPRMAGRDQQSAGSRQPRIAVRELQLWNWKRFLNTDWQKRQWNPICQPAAAEPSVCQARTYERPGCRGSSAAAGPILETEMEQTKTKRKASCSITRTGCSSNRQRPILPDRFQSSTFGVQGLNYCVRHGNRWIPLAIVTGYVVEGLSPQNFMKRHCNVLSSLRTHFSY